MIKRYVLRLSLAGLLLASGRGKALAESGLPAGALDPTFGDGGKVVTDLGGLEFLQAIAIQHDGRIVVGGGSDIAGAPDFALARYRRNGALDSRFGVGGTFLLDFGAVDFLNALALQRDGKIVAVGASNRPTGGDFALARLHSDGTLDSRFGNGGLVLTDFGQHESATAVAIQSDGKILVGGGAILPGATTRFAVARYDRDGQLDPTFGVDGVVLTDLGVAGGRLASLLVQKNGRIVAVGFASGAGGADFVLVRYTRRGELDPTFGTGGWVVTDLGGVDWALAAVLQDDGKIVAAGRGGRPASSRSLATIATACWTRASAPAAKSSRISARSASPRRWRSRRTERS